MSGVFYNSDEEHQLFQNTPAVVSVAAATVAAAYEPGGPLAWEDWSEPVAQPVPSISVVETDSDAQRELQDKADEAAVDAVANGPGTIKDTMQSGAAAVGTLIGVKTDENVRRAYIPQARGDTNDPRATHRTPYQRAQRHAREHPHQHHPLRVRATLDNTPRMCDGLTLLNAHGERLFKEARERLEPFANNRSLADLLGAAGNGGRRRGVGQHTLMQASAELMTAMRSGQVLNNGIYRYTPPCIGAKDKRAALVGAGVTSLARLFPHALIGEVEETVPSFKEAQDAVKKTLESRIGSNRTPEEFALLKKQATQKAQGAVLTATRAKTAAAAPGGAIAVSTVPVASANPEIQKETEATPKPAQVDITPKGLVPPAPNEEARVAALPGTPVVTMARVQADKDDDTDETANIDPVTSQPVKASLDNFRGEMAVLMETHANLFVRYIVGVYRGLRASMAAEAARDAQALTEHILDVLARDGLFNNSTAGGAGLTRSKTKLILERHNESSYERAEQALIGAGTRVKIAFDELRALYAVGREGQRVDGGTSVAKDSASSNVPTADTEALAELTGVFEKLMGTREVAASWLAQHVAAEHALVDELAQSGESQEFHTKRVAYVYMAYRLGLLVDASTYAFIVRRFDAFDEGLYRCFEDTECPENDEDYPPYTEPPPCPPPPPVKCVTEYVVLEAPCFHPCEPAVEEPCDDDDEDDVEDECENGETEDECGWGSWFDWACASSTPAKCTKTLCVAARLNDATTGRGALRIGRAMNAHIATLPIGQRMVGDAVCEAIDDFLRDTQGALKEVKPDAAAAAAAAAAAEEPSKIVRVPVRSAEEQLMAGYAVGQHVIAQLKNSADNKEQLVHFSVVLSRMLWLLFHSVDCERSCEFGRDAHQLALDIGSFMQPLSKRPFVRGVQVGAVADVGAPLVEQTLLGYIQATLEKTKVPDKLAHARRDACTFLPLEMPFRLARPLFMMLRGAIDAVAQSLFLPTSSALAPDTYDRNLIAGDWDRLFFRIEARLGKGFKNDKFVTMAGEPSTADIAPPSEEVAAAAAAATAEAGEEANVPPQEEEEQTEVPSEGGVVVEPGVAAVAPETVEAETEELVSPATPPPPPLPTSPEGIQLQAQRRAAAAAAEAAEAPAAAPAVTPMRTAIYDIDAAFSNADAPIGATDDNDDETLSNRIGRRRRSDAPPATSKTLTMPATMKAGVSLVELERRARIALILSENNIK